MAHVAKFSRASAPMILSHCLRHKDWNNEFVTYGNQSIDPKITPFNYRLDHNEDPQAFLKERLSQVKVQKRADVKVLCSWVVTVPKDLPHNKHREFFDSVYSFISKDVGEENVVLASVHVDETTPHMHFGFIPVVKEKKNKKKLGQEKVCAHDLLTRTYLKTFHKRLQAHLETQLGCSVGVLLPAEERDLEKNRLTMRELKKQTQEAKSLKKQNQALNAENQNLKDEARELEKNVKNLHEEREKLSIAPVPQVQVELPQPGLLLIESKKDYAKRALDAYREELDPAWRSLHAKADLFDKNRFEVERAQTRVKELESLLKEISKENNRLKQENSRFRQFAQDVLFFFKGKLPVAERTIDGICKYFRNFVRSVENDKTVQKRSKNDMER